MNQNDLVKALEANLPVLLIGPPGTGKTSCIRQAAQSLGMGITEICLALSLPEDIGGIPAPDKQGGFDYLLPAWWRNIPKDKPHLLLLDEINQANPSVLNAIYGLVLERQLRHESRPHLRVMAAGNRLSDSPYLVELPPPLLSRFYQVNWTTNTEEALKAIKNQTGVELPYLPDNFSPRSVEQAIKAFQVGLVSLAIDKAGQEIVALLESSHVSFKVSEIREAAREDILKSQIGVYL